MMPTQARSNNKIAQFTTEADMYGNTLTTGCEVLFGIGSKIRSGTVIRPTMVTITEKDDEAGDDDDADDTPRKIERTVPGVLIFNDAATNRKMVTRPCEDVCVVE